MRIFQSKLRGTFRYSTILSRELYREAINARYYDVDTLIKSASNYNRHQVMPFTILISIQFRSRVLLRLRQSLFPRNIELLTLRSLPWDLSALSCRIFLVALLGGRLANIFWMLSPENQFDRLVAGLREAGIREFLALQACPNP